MLRTFQNDIRIKICICNEFRDETVTSRAINAVTLSAVDIMVIGFLHFLYSQRWLEFLVKIR